MEQKEIKKITLEELIDVAKKYESGEWDPEKLDEYGQTLIIRSYIPLIDKISRIMSIMYKYKEQKYDSYEYKVLELYKNIFFDIILSEYALIDCDKKSLINVETYDLLYPMFSSYIINFCKIDYDNFINMLFHTISMYNSQEFTDVMNNLDLKTIEDVTKSNLEMINALNKNKEIVDKLDNISKMNDPQMADVANKIKEYAMNAINKI